MAEPLSAERRAEIRRTWEGVKPDKITVTGTRTPGALLHALTCAPRDILDLLAEVERLRGEVTRDKRWSRHFQRSRRASDAARWRAVKRYRQAEAERDQARTEVERLRGEAAAAEAARDRHGRDRDDARTELRYWRDRAEQAEAEREQLRQQLEAEAAYQGLLRDERDHLAEQVKRVREKHSPIAVHMGDPDDDDTLITACGECEVPYPCDTIRALDGEEA